MISNQDIERRKSSFFYEKGFSDFFEDFYSDEDSSERDSQSESLGESDSEDAEDYSDNATMVFKEEASSDDEQYVSREDVNLRLRPVVVVRDVFGDFKKKFGTFKGLNNLKFQMDPERLAMEVTKDEEVQRECRMLREELTESFLKERSKAIKLEWEGDGIRPFSLFDELDDTLGIQSPSFRQVGPRSNRETVGHSRRKLLRGTKKPHKCGICGKTFRHLQDRNAHAKAHDNDGSYKCAECGRAFMSVYYLRKHFKIHEKPKPHVCGVCGKSFAQVNELNAHFAFHTKDRPYKCDQCDKAFAHPSSLRKHAPLHGDVKPYVCAVCGKDFNRLDVCRVHQRSHIEAKPYKCSECGKAYKLKWNLQTHQLQHTDKKKWGCNICGEAFTRQPFLTNHMKKHAQAVRVVKEAQAVRVVKEEKD